ncbi:MAG: hypothetical protein IJZ85_04380 [Lachnospiraceae bacterium]|nr:hypothetical protein [Lachnospiraceae bacterium]
MPEAGDSFNGILATFLARENGLEEAVSRAVIVAGISVTRLGAAGVVLTERALRQRMRDSKLC